MEDVMTQQCTWKGAMTFSQMKSLLKTFIITSARKGQKTKRNTYLVSGIINEALSQENNSQIPFIQKSTSNFLFQKCVRIKTDAL